MSELVTNQRPKSLCPFISTATLVGTKPAGLITEQPGVVAVAAEAGCVENRCALWIDDSSMCAFKLQAIMMEEHRYDTQPPGPRPEPNPGLPPDNHRRSIRPGNRFPGHKNQKT